MSSNRTLLATLLLIGSHGCRGTGDRGTSTDVDTATSTVTDTSRQTDTATDVATTTDSDADTSTKTEQAETPLLTLQPAPGASNDRDADRINLILVGIGYSNQDQFDQVLRRDLALNGAPVHVAASLDQVHFGAFAVEPLKGNLGRFNLWVYPEQWTGDPSAFVSAARTGGTLDFGLGHVSYLFFVNPRNAAPQSFAYPSNNLPGEDLNKATLRFGTAVVTRYPDVIDGAFEVAHELGHSLFNLRDEYKRVSPELGDRYGHNLARTLDEAKALWGEVKGQVDPFYAIWKAARQQYGAWVDKPSPDCRRDEKAGRDICTWNADESDVRVGYFEGGGITTTGISYRPTFTSLMSNEDVRDQSWPQFPVVFGAANRRVMESVLELFSGE